MNFKLAWITIGAAFFVISCSNKAFLKTDNIDIAVERTNPLTVEVYATSVAKKEYLVLGEVYATADAGNDAKKVVKLLVFEAGKLGADAVIDLRLGFNYGFWNYGMFATATAIKYVGDE